MNHSCVCLALVAIVACESPKPGNKTTTTPQSNVVVSDTTEAAAVVRKYYGAIAAHDYDSAYALWEQSGQASHKTRAEFADGFARTTRVQVTITAAPQMGAAAGSQYATVPVVVDAVQSDSTKQHFTGTYTLRRAMVDGATPEQRAWHIYSADLKEATTKNTKGTKNDESFFAFDNKNFL